VSCNTKSTDELAKIILVTLLKTNKKINLETHKPTLSNSKSEDIIIVNQEKILTLVGTLITIVAAVKYERVSMSIPIVNMW
jgi:hypothetical protein